MGILLACWPFREAPPVPYTDSYVILDLHANAFTYITVVDRPLLPMVMRSDSILMTSSQTDRLGDLTLMCMKKNSNKNTKRLKLTSKLTGQGKEPRIWGRLTEMQWTRYVEYVMWNNPSDDNYMMIPRICTTALLHYCKWVISHSWVYFWPFKIILPLGVAFKVMPLLSTCTICRPSICSRTDLWASFIHPSPHKQSETFHGKLCHG